MRIALRPSGGRGDYELAGSYNGLHASDLLEKDFFYQVTPSLVLQGKAKAHRLNGKPRIRPENDGQHPYVLMYSILLLPPPRRELIKTTSTDFIALANQSYIIAGIDVDVVGSDTAKVVFAPTNIWTKNQVGVLKIDFAERMSIISSLWFAATFYKSELSTLLLKHQAAVTSSDHLATHRVAKEIYKRFKADFNIIPLILQEFNLKPENDYAGVSANTTGYETEENYSSPNESKHELLKKWRKQADRGLGAREFSLAVREAYDYRCLFSGERFPKLEMLDSAGVDGAHILPWSTYQLNAVTMDCVCLSNATGLLIMDCLDLILMSA